MQCNVRRSVRHGRRARKACEAKAFPEVSFQNWNADSALGTFKKTLPLIVGTYQGWWVGSRNTAKELHTQKQHIAHQEIKTLVSPLLQHVQVTQPKRSPRCPETREMSLDSRSPALLVCETTKNDVLGGAVKSTLQNQTTWVQIPALPHTSQVTLKDSQPLWLNFLIHKMGMTTVE